jgi:hypothetical protein
MLLRAAKGYRSAPWAEFSRTCYADRPIFSLSKSHYSDRNDFNLHASYRNWRVVILHRNYCLLRKTAGLLLGDCFKQVTKWKQNEKWMLLLHHPKNRQISQQNNIILYLLMLNYGNFISGRLFLADITNNKIPIFHLL